ncbi:UrcA family protein [Erythrobacter rubeus]|uniref:UrcA family protein n=1 Tax=Erythrobacter rubeus TaxID=2760803 RepID=A0ABR8KR14_9SPHN|nr:UrcA family protein [Erythrobacter rubeus]MBD2843145.1 UrcA family protein [Erythrobacter rubeus]
MKTVALAIALTLGAAGTPASAEPGLNTVAIDYADLNLTSSEGRAVLDKRIKKAVRQVCATPWTRSIRAGSASRKCIKNTMKVVAPIRDQVIAQAQAEVVSAELAHKSR